MTGYRPREAVSLLDEALSSVPVVVLTGMRQTGKTTILLNDPAFRAWRHVSLDDFAQLEAARRDPDALLAGAAPVAVDEAQRCPDLLLAVKRAVDRERRPGRFLLSGSANLALLRGVAESLSGRALYLPLHPFSRREVLGRTSRTPWIRTVVETGTVPRPHKPSSTSPVTMSEVLRGGLPPVCLGEARDPSLWLQGFEQTYLERDLRALSQVADLVAFRHLMRLASLRTGQVLNQSELGRDARLNAATAGRYLSLLETSFVVARLAPFLGNRASRLIRAPKLYFTDAGLAAHLTGVTEEGLAREDVLRGALFETWVLQNLSAILASRMPRARLTYWNVQGRHEVDFVIESGRDVLAIEVKSGPRWERRDLAGLEAFLAATPRCPLALLAHNGSETVSLGERLWAVPVSVLLS